MTAYVDVLAGVGACCPLDEGNLSAVHFDAGNCVGMDAGTGIAVAGAFRVEPWPVSVACNKVSRVCKTPAAQVLFYLFTFVAALGGTGRILETAEFKWPPYISDKPAGDFPALIVKRVCLVTVNEMIAVS